MHNYFPHDLVNDDIMNINARLGTKNVFFLAQILVRKSQKEKKNVAWKFAKVVHLNYVVYDTVK